MTGFPLVSLREVCEQARITIRPGGRNELRYVGLETIEAGTGVILDGQFAKTPEDPKANSFLFGSQHVLYGKLRPYLNKVAVPDFEGKCSTEIIPLLPNHRLNRNYLAYFLRSPSTVERIAAKTASARMPRADMDLVLGLHLPLPPLEEQRRIVDLLSRAEGIMRLRREAQKKAAELLGAIFLDMFGDPAANIRGWPTAALSEVAEVISGVAKGRKLDGRDRVKVPYMRVANVKDGYLDLSEVKTIDVQPGELTKLLLEPGDLLLTEGADADKLGRGALWRAEIERCVHQNHVFKVRSDGSKVVPEYLKELVGSHYGKSYFLRVAKRTTGIASINKTQLSAFPVIVPPIELQSIFGKAVVGVESIAKQQASASTSAQAAFSALLSKAFHLEICDA